MNRGGTLPRRPALVVDAQDIEADARIEGSDWEAHAASASHVQPFLDPLAYRIETGGGSIVITGDTEPCDAVVELAQGATALVSMCWDHQHVMDEFGEAHG